MYAANLFCQRGAFVLKPNYHGSTNYGLKWLESITRGGYVGPELDDIERGVDALIARGLVDIERLGLCGWSNGAILSNALTARTTRFRAAAVGAGNVEYVSDWANCDFGDAFDRFYLGASPLEDAGLYLRKSPFYRLGRVRTPTLIFHGTEDRVVSPEQGWTQYRALQQLGKADVRFVLFPGEKHILKKLAHQRRKLEEELAWFDRHLFGPAKPANEALKPDAPLAWALKRQAARRDGGRFGVREKGVLVPETVERGGLRVGRFEVTRAQFAEFDKGYRVEPGRENFPAAGVGFAQARDYCTWLSRVTGRTYRLPTEAEGADLYEKSEPGENTLDQWAGYGVNPDDAARLREAVQGLGPGALLREVGSSRGDGEDAVFDLGGNAAEWVTAADGAGKLMGGSADAPADPKRRASDAAPEYRGFRVVQGATP
jgi:dienelactone hydrolase